MQSPNTVDTVVAHQTTLQAAPVSEKATAHLRQGHRCARAEALASAITHYTEAIRLHPACAEAYLGRGEAFRRLNRLDPAAADFRKAAALAPDLALAHQLLGGACLALGRWQEAVAAYDAALRLDPGQAVAFLNRGLAHAKRGDTDEAIADAEAALRLNPDLDEAYYLRAVACTRQRKNDQAIADLTRLLEAHPDLWRAYYMRGLAHANEGDYDRAVADLGQALRLSPGLLAAHFQRGIAYRLKGEHGLAVIELTRFLHARPDSPRALFQRALAHQACGRCDQAVADLDRVLELDPHDQEARERLEQARREREKAAPEPAAIGEAATTPPMPPPLPEPAPATVLWLTCPECGATAQISWKRLDRKFQCRGCKNVFHVDAEGKFTEANPRTGRPHWVGSHKRFLAGAAGVCLVGVLLGWFFLRQRDAGPPPLPHDLEARGQLWGKAWISNDRYLMRRLTDPANDRALFPWARRNPPPQFPDSSDKKGGPDAEIEAHVDRSAAHAAVLLIRIKSPSLKAPVEVRQNWVERGEGWYFVPS